MIIILDITHIIHITVIHGIIAVLIILIITVGIIHISTIRGIMITGTAPGMATATPAGTIPGITIIGMVPITPTIITMAPIGMAELTAGPSRTISASAAALPARAWLEAIA